MDTPGMDGLVIKQLSHLAIACTAAGIWWWIPLHQIKNYAYVFGLINIMMLVLVLIIGDSSGGSQRWLSFGGLRFQPSEIAKITVPLVAARFLSDHKLITSHTLRSLTPLITIIMMFFVCVFKQPDLGTSGILIAIIISQLFCVQIKKNTVMITTIIGTIGAIWGWFFLLKDYQKLRIQSLIFPNLDPVGSSYNSIQSLIAVGSGGVWGKGFGGSTQSHHHFLPSHHTDFVFSVFAEEHGFLKTLVLLLIIMLFLTVCFEIARQAKDTFSALTAVGISAALLLDFAINIAMVIGLFPVVGVPMPFFSYGGSAGLKTIIACAILMKIDTSKQTRSYSFPSSGISYGYSRSTHR